MNKSKKDEGPRDIWHSIAMRLDNLTLYRHEIRHKEI